MGNDLQVANAKQDDMTHIRLAVRQLCAKYGEDYWLNMDRTSGYPSDFVAELLGSSGPAIVMNKGAVAILEVNDPKQLAAGESFPGSAASLVALIDPSWVAQGRKKR